MISGTLEDLHGIDDPSFREYWGSMKNLLVDEKLLMDSTSASAITWLIYIGALLIGIVVAILLYVYWPHPNPLLVPPSIRRFVDVQQPCDDDINVCLPNLICVKVGGDRLGTCLRPLGQVCSFVSDCVPEATACANGICVRATPEMLDVLASQQGGSVDALPGFWSLTKAPETPSQTMTFTVSVSK